MSQIDAIFMGRRYPLGASNTPADHTWTVRYDVNENTDARFGIPGLADIEQITLELSDRRPENAARVGQVTWDAADMLVAKDDARRPTDADWGLLPEKTVTMPDASAYPISFYCRTIGIGRQLSIQDTHAGVGNTFGRVNWIEVTYKAKVIPASTSDLEVRIAALEARLESFSLTADSTETTI